MNPLSQTPIHTNAYVEQEQQEDALFIIRVVHLVPQQKKIRVVHEPRIHFCPHLLTKPSHAMQRLQYA